MTDTAKIDSFYAGLSQWKEEMSLLRDILRSTDLVEEVKWHQPIYTYNGGNVAMPAGFKHRCVLSFHKGALLSDPKGILEPPGPNTRAARIVPFHSSTQIEDLRPTLIAYLNDAIALEVAGKKVSFAKDDLTPPEELERALADNPDLASAFDALTPGRRRAWITHIAQAKQASTREDRIAKARPHILNGKGLNGR